MRQGYIYALLFLLVLLLLVTFFFLSVRLNVRLLFYFCQYIFCRHPSMHSISVSVSNKWSWNTNSTVLWHIVSFFSLSLSIPLAHLYASHRFQSTFATILFNAPIQLGWRLDSFSDHHHCRYFVVLETKMCNVISLLFPYACTVQFHYSLRTAGFLFFGFQPMEKYRHPFLFQNSHSFQ